MSNDGRYAIVTATAGGVSVSETITTYDPAMGESLRIVELVLKDVPSGITSLSLTVESPTSGGDSFAIGGSIEVQSQDAESTFPVEWMGFTAEMAGNAALLKWSTASEINSDYYIVERSFDRESYEQLSRVKAAGMSDSPTYYEFTDEKIAGMSQSAVVYRLLQVDLDGSYDKSNEVELQLQFENNFQLTTFPNPVSDILNINYQSQQGVPTRLEILNLAGQMMTQQDLPFQAGGNTIQIPVGEWPSGMYVVQVSDENHRSFSRIQVQ